MLPKNGIITTKAKVVKEWIDSNEHMNVAYYLIAFEKGFDTYKDLIGMDIQYIKAKQKSTVSLEAHICYRAEAMLDDTLRVETRIVNFDTKRAHVYQEMYRNKLLLATQETLSISFDIKKRKTCNFEEKFLKHYAYLCKVQAVQKIKGNLGSSIRIPRRKLAKSSI